MAEETKEEKTPEVEAVATAQEDPNETQTYYLRPGARHTVIRNGEQEKLTQAGTPVELTGKQFQAFKDKFYTQKQLEAAEEEGKIVDGQATAADELIPAPGAETQALQSGATKTKEEVELEQGIDNAAKDEKAGTPKADDKAAAADPKSAGAGNAQAKDDGKSATPAGNK